MPSAGPSIKPCYGIWARFSQPKEKTLWYYRSLTERFSERLPGQLSDELREIVKVLEASREAPPRQASQ
jgi:hypothetical protein